MPSNGIFARVLQEGEISVRDTIQVLPETGKEPFRAAVITLSDKGAAGEREDKSDPLAEKLLTEAISSSIGIGGFVRPMVVCLQ